MRESIVDTASAIIGCALLLGWIWLLGRAGGARRKSSTRRPCMSHGFDLANIGDVGRIDDVRAAYASVLDSSPYAACAYQPVDVLPASPEEIRRALRALRDVAAGVVAAPWLANPPRTREAVTALEQALARVDDFLPLPVGWLPTDPAANLHVGAAWITRTRHHTLPRDPQ